MRLANRMKKLTGLTAAIFIASCSTEPRPLASTPVSPANVSSERANIVAIGQAAIDDLLSRDGFMMYEVDEVSALHYAEAAAIYGAAKFAGLTEDAALMNELLTRVERMDAEGLPNTANHVDANLVGIIPLELYIQGEGDAFLSKGLDLADGQWDNPRKDGLTSQTRFWIDDVWMIGALQVQAYRATGNQVYLDRAALETVAYLDRLQQSNGLFHHGPDAPFFWGRGNGWVAAGLAEVISELPEDHPDYPRIRDGYTTMMAALLDYQAEDGMWRQLIDYPDAWKETSATAMFGFAMASGVNAGLLDDDVYGDSAERAWNALQGYLTADGRLTDVCVGTGQSENEDYYLNRPRQTGDFHAQAPLLWFASERLENL